jgi:hypothetical protein
MRRDDEKCIRCGAGTCLRKIGKLWVCMDLRGCLYRQHEAATGALRDVKEQAK